MEPTGSKLVGAFGLALQGAAVSLSGDGNTAVVGAPGVDSGGALIFIRRGGAWTSVAPPLVGVGLSGSEEQPDAGASVALSQDGGTAIISSALYGEAWVFRPSGSTWVQQGLALGPGSAGFGTSVAITNNGNTAIIGDPQDSSDNGAAWIFVPHRNVATHDFNGDNTSDLLWRDGNGDTVMWLLHNGAVSQAGALGTVPTIWSVVGQGDFNGDATSDILWRDSTGDVAIWTMNGLSVEGRAALGQVATNWQIYGTGDLNGDGVKDLLWRDTNSGAVVAWFMQYRTSNSNEPTFLATASYGTVPATWTIVGDDNKGNIFWEDTAGNLYFWQVNGAQKVATGSLGNVPPSVWQIVGLADFDGDGNTDILWRDTAGDVVIWFLNSSLGVASTASLGNVPTTWTVAQTGDYNGDGMSDIFWIDNSGNTAIWFMNGSQVASTESLGSVGTTWTLQGQNAQ